jgi:hypothetical protein
MSQHLAINPEQLQNVAASDYYKELQENIRKKHKPSEAAIKKEDTDSVRTDQDKVQAAAKAVAASKVDKLKNIKDRVDIRSFTWVQDDKGKFQMDRSEQNPIISSIDLSNRSTKVLKEMGHKIDFMEKLPQLKTAYMQNMVQSKSANFFLAKFAQFKVGMMGRLLSLLGVPAEDIQKLRREAIEGAAEENVLLMAENIYNIEITELIYGRGRKAMQALALFKEIEFQLLKQMELLGKAQYWTKLRLLEEKMKQCKKIKDEFAKEKESLSYEKEYRGDE